MLKSNLHPMVSSEYEDLIPYMTYEVAASCMSGSMIGPVGSARRRAMRSERPLRSTLDWAEAREAASTSIIRISRNKTKRDTTNRWQQTAN